MKNLLLSNRKFILSNKLKMIQIQRKKINIIRNIRRNLPPFAIRNNYNSIIPLNIFQTWHSYSLPPLMARAVHKLRLNNPRFKYHLYNDNDCREFIKNNYNEEILNAFDNLIPGAYKADLWRYCILYKLGGIYVDIKYECFNHFKFIHLTESEHFVSDIDGQGIYNALMVCLPGNPILWEAIQKIVQNVREKYYGPSCLHPTGPMLLANIIRNRNNVDMKHRLVSGNFNNRVIIYDNTIILKSYNGYISESRHHQNTEHYSVLWNRRHIYN
jgi:mannosyltransferase OCH1-like enzyme